MHCDEHVFRNYSGVEEERTIEEEMQNHLDKGRLAALDTYDLLKEFVGGEPILNKLGVIVKIRNGVRKARAILETKESGVKWITSNTHRG